MRFIWIIPAILIMIMPESWTVVLAAEPTSLAVSSVSSVSGMSEALLLILIGGIFIWIAALGRKAKRHTPTKVHHAPAYPQQRS